MTRRTFIQSVSAATLSASVFGQSKKKIKVGVLGATHSHAAEKIRLLAASQDFEFIGIVGAPETIRRTHPTIRSLSEPELFELAEAVFVESEVRDHARHALAALRAGKHVHVEKPPSAKWREMQELVATAREKNLLLQSGYMWRYNPGFQTVFEAVRAGWLGEIYQVRGSMTNQLAPAGRAEWAEFSGGAFFEQASHLVDAAIRLLGRPNSVTPIHQSRQQDDLKDNNVAIFEFPKALAIIANSTHQPNASAHRSFEVLGTNGTMTLKPIEAPILELDLSKPAGPYNSGRHQIPLPKYSRYVGDLADFAQALRGGKLAASLDDELLVHEWVLRSSKMWTEN